ncbi:hypothetical protein N7495_001016 [Penicillium taxi]|uniref:uncharacterized protein n=1 Tax=Penicillium taxi TaxID=168475 RepID=UPI002545A74A|nr:uncharacterized protein N7495_001016 [Penicillium taxi]KAJ5908334.1 hypothetical protein N7495_001016 [Penicillium taxi]
MAQRPIPPLGKLKTPVNDHDNLSRLRPRPRPSPSRRIKAVQKKRDIYQEPSVGFAMQQNLKSLM